jgi:hypothetical protein
MNATAYNERIKYFARLLNTIAAAAISIGILAPLVAALYGIGAAQSVPSVPVVVLGSILWAFLAASLHASAQWLLGNLIG